MYAVLIEDGVNEILNDLHLADSFFGLETGISPWFWKMIRGVKPIFVEHFAAGSVKDPEKENTSLK